MEIKPLIKDDYLEVQKDGTVSAMVGQLKETNKRNALVFDHDKFLGIVEDKWLMKAKLNPTQTKITNLVKRIPLAQEDMDLIETAYLMFQSNLNFIPVTNGKQISGVVYGLDLLKAATELPQLKGLTVGDIKLTKPEGLKPTEKIVTALRMMFDERLEQFPVIDQGKLYGVLSFRDILKKYSHFPVNNPHGSKAPGLSTRGFQANRPEIDKLPLGSFATTTNLATIKKEDKLLKAITLMHKQNVQDLVVADEDELLGILTIKNILRKIASLKVVENFNIKFVGLEKTHLQPYQKYNLKKIASQEAFKLQRGVKNEFSVTIHIKEYEKAGKGDKQHKYSVNLKVNYPGQAIISDKGKQGTWDIEAALRQAFNNAKNNIKKKFKGDSSHRKEYE